MGDSATSLPSRKREGWPKAGVGQQPFVLPSRPDKPRTVTGPPRSGKPDLPLPQAGVKRRRLHTPPPAHPEQRASARDVEGPAPTLAALRGLRQAQAERRWWRLSHCSGNKLSFSKRPLADSDWIGSSQYMNTSAEAPPASWKHRAGSAALGFGVTAATLVAIAAAQIFFADAAIERAGFDPTTSRLIASDLREKLISDHARILATVAAYWMMCFVLGRGQILRVKSANVTLAGAVLTFALAIAIASITPEPVELFQWACPIFGLSDTMPKPDLERPKFGFDVPTPCEAVLSSAIPAIMLGLPLLLFVMSAILRVALSRRNTRDVVL